MKETWTSMKEVCFVFVVVVVVPEGDDVSSF